MSQAVFGEIDWNSGDVGSSDKPRVEFMRLEAGTSTVRIMGNPHQFYIHWLTLPDGSKKKINSPVTSPDLLKQLDEADFKRKPRWVVKVLDRSDDKFKLLEIGSQIYNGIKALYNNPKWGKVTEYDVDIIRGKPGANPLYAIQPNPKEKLSSEFRDAFMEFNDSINMDLLTKPADPVEVKKMMKWGEFVNETPESSGASEKEGGFDFDFEE